MHSLRSARFLARLVLAWFVLSVGLAVAAPMVQPRGLDMVCVGAGMQLLPFSEDGSAPQPMGLDCPLCSMAAAPPPAPGVATAPAVRFALPAPRLAAPLPTAASPLPPARGPPARAFA